MKWKLVLQRSPQYPSFELLLRWKWWGIFLAWLFVQLHPWGEACLYKRKELL